MLIYQHGTFLHALEGETGDVLALFDKVSPDPRHRNVQTLVQIEVERRRFVGQPMGFYEAAEEEMELGGAEEFDDFTPPHQISWRGRLALQLLARFRS